MKNNIHQSPSGSGHPRVKEVLAKMRRSFLRAGQWRALVVVLLLMIGMAFLDALVGLSLPLRWMGWLGTLLVAGAIIFLWRKRSQRVREASAVEAVENAFPAVGQLPRTAFDLQSRKVGPESGVSPEMAADVVKRASRFWMGVRPESVVDVSDIKRWPRVAALAAFGFLICYVSWGDFRTATVRILWPSSNLSFTRLADKTEKDSYRSETSFRFEVEAKGRKPEEVKVVLRSGEGEPFERTLEQQKNGIYKLSMKMPPGGFSYTLIAGDAQVDWRAVECLDAAVLLSSSGVVTPPDYTGLEPIEFENGDVEGLEGSRTELVFKMSAPMREAKLVFDDGEELLAQCDDRQILVTTELVSGKRVYDLVGFDEKGHELNTVKFLMDGRADEMPKIKIIEPKKEMAATPVGEVPVRIRASDDVGLGEVGIILEAQGEHRELLHFPIEEDGSLEVKKLALAALEEFSLSINDNVRLYAFAKDKKPRGDARTISSMRAIDIQQFQTRWYQQEAGEP